MFGAGEAVVVESMHKKWIIALLTVSPFRSFRGQDSCVLYFPDPTCKVCKS